MSPTDPVVHRCPKCSSEWVVRVQRQWWMRLFPNSVALRCGMCKETSLSFGPFWPRSGRHTTMPPIDC